MFVVFSRFPLNSVLLLLIPPLCYYAAYRFYLPWIARKMGEDPQAVCPSLKYEDGRDYCPTRSSVVFAGHFSGIAGAGPILGPTMALLYGVAPAWCWIIIGGIFFGAVHDYLALMVSLREDGRTIAEICRRRLGTTTYLFFLLFLLLLMALVNSSFLATTAKALTSSWPVDKIPGFDAGSSVHIIRTSMINGVEQAHIGGIASTSVVFITLLAPLLGWIFRKFHLSTVVIYLIASFICLLSVIFGIFFPITTSADNWMMIVSIYTLLAAGLPIWLIIQPRDFINVQLLYIGLIAMILSLVSVTVQGTEIQFPLMNLAEGTSKLGSLWPMLFITVACGAISGFHSLLASGTTSKLIHREPDARRVGYGSMLLESFLAICALLTLAIGLSKGDYMAILWPADNAGSNPILAFSLAAAQTFYAGLGIPVQLGTVCAILLLEGFVVTTLDVAVRLTRLLMEEFWRAIFHGKPPRLLTVPWFNSTLTVIIMLLLAKGNAFNVLWPIFGTANQLLAMLTFIVIIAWLTLRHKLVAFVLLPAVFMGATTLWALLSLIPQYYDKGNWALLVTAVGLIITSCVIIVRGLFIKPVAKDA